MNVTSRGMTELMWTTHRVARQVELENVDGIQEWIAALTRPDCWDFQYLFQYIIAFTCIQKLTLEDKYITHEKSARLVLLWQRVINDLGAAREKGLSNG